MRWKRTRFGLSTALLIALGGCQHPNPLAAAEPPSVPPIESEVYQRAEVEREVERLRADLRQAEASLAAMESGLRGFQSRADAVSALAEARIAVEREGPKVPWRRDRVEEARAKLREAERQLEEGHFGSAVFFASRAERITESLCEEVRQVEARPGRRLVIGRRVNLRAGPSTDDRVLRVLVARTPVLPERRQGDWTLVLTPAGQVGWVHDSLLSRSQTTQSLPASLAR
jgi:hypothetical protein